MGSLALDGLLAVAIKAGGSFLRLIGGPAQGALNFLSPLTAAYNAATGNVDIGLGSVAPPSGIVLGSQNPPQVVLSVGPTLTVSTGGSPAQIANYPNSSPLITFGNLGIAARIPLASPGILLWGRVQIVVYSGAYGTTTATSLATTNDPYRSTLQNPWISSVFSIGGSGSNIVLTVQAPTFQAFASHGSYSGTVAAGSIPNAIGDSENALVTNGGHLYVVTSGGTDSGSGGPTTTTPGSPQTVGGITYYYVGPASAGVTSYITATLTAVETG